MPIEDVFLISGRVTVVTGRIERGIVNVGDEIEIIGYPRYHDDCMYRRLVFLKLLGRRSYGRERVGVLLRGTGARALSVGQVLSKEGLQSSPHKNLRLQVYILSKDGWSSHAILQKATVHSSISVLQT